MFWGGMVRGLGGYCSGGASREASSCGGEGLCLFASVRSVIEYTPLKVPPIAAAAAAREQLPRANTWLMQTPPFLFFFFSLVVRVLRACLPLC